MRQIVTTHLDPDHSGGLPDFPEAEVHVFGRELDAALDPRLRDRPRYLGVPLEARPAAGSGTRSKATSWFGFEGVRILPDLGAEMLLVPLAGHSLGHTGVAIKTGEGWLLHCGDAYFHHGEIATPPAARPACASSRTSTTPTASSAWRTRSGCASWSPATATRCGCSARTTRTSWSWRRPSAAGAAAA